MAERSKPLKLPFLLMIGIILSIASVGSATESRSEQKAYKSPCVEIASLLDDGMLPILALTHKDWGQKQLNLESVIFRHLGLNSDPTLSRGDTTEIFSKIQKAHTGVESTDFVSHDHHPNSYKESKSKVGIARMQAAAKEIQALEQLLDDPNKTSKFLNDYIHALVEAEPIELAQLLRIEFKDLDFIKDDGPLRKILVDAISNLIHQKRGILEEGIKRSLDREYSIDSFKDDLAETTAVLAITGTISYFILDLILYGETKNFHLSSALKSIYLTVPAFSLYTFLVDRQKRIFARWFRKTMRAFGSKLEKYNPYQIIKDLDLKITGLESPEKPLTIYHKRRMRDHGEIIDNPVYEQAIKLHMDRSISAAQYVYSLYNLDAENQQSINALIEDNAIEHQPFVDIETIVSEFEALVDFNTPMNFVHIFHVGKVEQLLLRDAHQAAIWQDKASWEQRSNEIQEIKKFTSAALQIAKANEIEQDEDFNDAKIKSYYSEYSTKLLKLGQNIDPKMRTDATSRRHDFLKNFLKKQQELASKITLYEDRLQQSLERSDDPKLKADIQFNLDQVQLLKAVLESKRISVFNSSIEQYLDKNKTSEEISDQEKDLQNFLSTYFEDVRKHSTSFVTPISIKALDKLVRRLEAAHLQFGQ